MYKPDVTFNTTMSPASAFERTLLTLKAIGTVTKIATDENRIDALVSCDYRPSWLEIRVGAAESGTKIDVEVVGFHRSPENIAKRVAHAFDNFDKPGFIADTDGIPRFLSLALGLLPLLFAIGVLVYFCFLH